MRYLLFLIMSGCLSRVSPVEDVPDVPVDTSDSMPSTQEWSVRKIQPAFGSTAGGDLLLISGSGFSDPITVEIAGQEVGLEEVTESGLSFYSPAVSGAGPVDVRVKYQDQEWLLDNAFTYFKDADGLATGVGVLQKIAFLGEYWEGPMPEEYSGRFGFLERPEDTWFGDIAWGGTDGCGSTPETFWPEATPVDAEVLRLKNAQRRIELPQSESGYFINEEIDGGQWADGLTYALQGIGNPEGFVLSTASFVKTGSPFYVETPEMDGADLTEVNVYGLRFAWRENEADWMYGLFEQLCPITEDEFELVQSVSCASKDETGHGDFALGPELFPDWRAGCFLVVQMSAVQEEPDAGYPWLSYDRSELRIAGVYTQLGVLWTQ